MVCESDFAIIAGEVGASVSDNILSVERDLLTHGLQRDEVPRGKLCCYFWLHPDALGMTFGVIHQHGMLCGACSRKKPGSCRVAGWRHENNRTLQRNLRSYVWRKQVIC